jgi:K+-transporting ATPase ATPase C chain
MKLFINALLMTIVLTLLLGVLYPLAMTGLSQVLFPNQANGSLITVNGKTVGSHLIGQTFADAKNFHSRISAINYSSDSAQSGGTNLGPTSQGLHDRIKHDADSLHKLYPELPATLPSDMLTSSASGLDPDISVANALAQVPIVAKANGLDPAKVEQLVRAHIKTRTLGVLGEDVVNVLELNLDLHALKPSHS